VTIFPVFPLASLATTFDDGDWIESKDQSEDGIRLIQTGNVGEGQYLDKGQRARFISDETSARLRCTEIHEGDVLISRLPDPVGRSCRLPQLNQRAITAVDCTIIRFDERRILPEYFVYYSQSDGYQRTVDSLCTGATRRRISRTNLAAVEVPLPPLAEQKRIVAILDEAFEGIAKATANAERNLANAWGLLPTVLDQVLTTVEGAQVFDLEHAVDDDCSLSYGIVQPGDEIDDGLPIVRPTDIGAREVGLDGLKRIDAGRAAGYQRTTLKGRDLLRCVRGTTGVLSQASAELAGANVTRGIVPIRFKSDILSQDLGYFVLRSDGVQRQIRAATYGAALMQINIRDVRKIKVVVPPSNKQPELLTRLEQVASEADRLAANYTHQLSLLDALKSGLLHKAFSGQLTGKEAVVA
jgi:type I restriction enzyme S subunit